MNIPSIQSGHWTDEELLAYLYGVGPSTNHLAACSQCQSRLSEMQANRAFIDQSAFLEHHPTSSFLAAQRRAIYQQMEKPSRWWVAAPVRRWAAGVATVCIVGGSLSIYQHNQQVQMLQERMNDAKLAQEVAAMAEDSGVPAMAPLEGLFE